MFDRLKARAEWKFFGVLLKADRSLAIAWWAALWSRGLLPALFAIAMGALAGAVQRGNPPATPRIAVGVVFLLLQIITTAPPCQPRKRLGAYLCSQCFKEIASAKAAGLLKWWCVNLQANASPAVSDTDQRRHRKPSCLEPVSVLTDASLKLKSLPNRTDGETF